MNTYAPAIPVARNKKIQRRWLYFFAFQAVHILVFSCFIQYGVIPAALVGSGVACLMIYGVLLFRQLSALGAELTPIEFYLAASIFRLGLGTLYTTSLYMNGLRAELLVGRIDVSAYLMVGHLISMVGDFMFLLGCRLGSGRNRPDSNPGIPYPSSYARIYLTACLFYVISACIRGASYSVDFGGVGQLGQYIADYGPAASTLMMLSVVKSSRRAAGSVVVLIAVAATVVNILWSLFSYMKSDVFVALLPVVLVSFAVFKDRFVRAGPGLKLRQLLLLGLVTYVFLFVISAYSQLRRPDFWSNTYQTKPATETTVPVAHHLVRSVESAIPGTGEFDKLHRYPDRGVWGMISRMSMMPYPAWAYGRVKTTGNNPDSFIESLMIAITPRIIWTDKPSLSPGADFAATIGLARSASSSRTAVALTMQGAYYWWGGPVGLILGCLASGIGFTMIWRCFWREKYVNPVSAMLALMLCYMGFHWFEDAFLGGFPFYFYSLIVFAPCQVLVRQFVRFGPVLISWKVKPVGFGRA